MRLFSKKRTVVLGGLKIDVYLKNGEVKNTEVFGQKIRGYDSIKFSRDFLNYLEKRNNNDVVNLDNPLLRKQLGEYLVDKQIEKIFNETSRYLRKFESKNNKKSISQLLETGLLSEEDVASAVHALNKPIGLKGLMYNVTKGVATFISNYSKKFRGEVYNKNQFKDSYRDLQKEKEKEKENVENEEEKKSQAEDKQEVMEGQIKNLAKSQIDTVNFLEKLEEQLNSIIKQLAEEEKSNNLQNSTNIATQEVNNNIEQKANIVHSVQNSQKKEIKKNSQDETLRDYLSNKILKGSFKEWNLNNPGNEITIEEKASLDNKQKSLYSLIKNNEISLESAKKELNTFANKILSNKGGVEVKEKIYNREIPIISKIEEYAKEKEMSSINLNFSDTIDGRESARKDLEASTNKLNETVNTFLNSINTIDQKESFKKIINDKLNSLTAEDLKSYSSTQKFDELYKGLLKKIDEKSLAQKEILTQNENINKSKKTGIKNFVEEEFDYPEEKETVMDFGGEVYGDFIEIMNKKEVENFANKTKKDELKQS